MTLRMSQHPLWNDPLVQRTVAALVEVSGNDHVAEVLDEYSSNADIILASEIVDAEVVSCAIILDFSQHTGDLEGKLPQSICDAVRIMTGEDQFEDSSAIVSRTFRSGNIVAQKFLLTVLTGAYGSEETRRLMEQADGARAHGGFAQCFKNILEVNEQITRYESWRAIPAGSIGKYAEIMEGFVRMAPDDWAKRAALNSLDDLRRRLVAAETPPPAAENTDDRISRLKEASRKYRFKPR